MQDHANIELNGEGLQNSGALSFTGNVPGDGGWDSRMTSHRFVTYRSNRAVDRAGSIWMGSGGHIVENTVFDSNEATEAAGVFLVSDSSFPSTAVITATAFSNNRAVQGAGLLINHNSNGILSQVTFTNNLARSKGGGIAMLSTGSLDLQIAAFTANEANGPGSALYADSPREIKIVDTVWSPFEPAGGATVSLSNALDGCTVHPCSPGYSCSYSDFSMTCTPCAQNLYSADGISCGLCAAGTGPNAEQTGCEACAAGQTSDVGICMASDPPPPPPRCPCPASECADPSNPGPPPPPCPRCPPAPPPCADPEPCPMTPCPAPAPSPCGETSSGGRRQLQPVEAAQSLLPFLAPLLFMAGVAARY